MKLLNVNPGPSPSPRPSRNILTLTCRTCVTSHLYNLIWGNSHGGTIPPRTPPGSAWVRAGPRRTPAESAKFNFAAEQKIPPRNPPRTRPTAAEQICSAADPIGSAADWRNFRRRNALKRVRASPPQGYSESVRRGLLRNFVYAELFRDRRRCRGTIPRQTTVSRNHSAANNCAADLFRQRFITSSELQLPLTMISYD